MTQRSWPRYVAAYLVWVVLLVLGLWLVFLSREGFLAALTVFYVRGSTWRGWQVGFYDKAYTIGAGSLWLVFMVVTEEYLRTGVERRDLLRRVARVAGAELLLLFVADLSLLLLQGVGMRNWLRWLIIGSQIAVGAVLLLFASSSRTPKPDKAGLDRAA